MLETDADRLETIKSLGGQLVPFESDSFWAIFDEPGAQSRFDDTHINSTSPQLTLRTSDVDRLGLKRATTINLDGTAYLVREHQRGEAPGWSVLVLDEP